jgi:phospholipid/cholesterol/gamma-HCH transport system substrate-binding protein
MSADDSLPGRRVGPSDEELRTAVPRDTGSREARVGFFVIVGLLSFVTVLFLMTDPATLRGRYMLVTQMVDAGGVRRGDAVQMRGVSVGRVHGFDLRSGPGACHVISTPACVDITLEIEGDWQIPEGSHVELTDVGLFGGRTVEIFPGDGRELLVAFDTLPGASERSDLFQMAAEVGDRATAVLDRLAGMIDEPTVGSLRTTMDEIQGMARELREIAADQRDDLARLSESLNRSAGGLESAAAAGPDFARAVARADSALATLNRTSATLEGASSSLNVILARVEAGEGTFGRLSADDSLYLNLNETITSVRLLMEDVRANPGRYINVSIF